MVADNDEYPRKSVTSALGAQASLPAFWSSSARQARMPALPGLI